MLNSASKFIKKASSASYTAASKSIKFSQQIFIKRAERLSKVSKKVGNKVAKYLDESAPLEILKEVAGKVKVYVELLPVERKLYTVKLVRVLWRLFKEVMLHEQFANFLSWIEESIIYYNPSLDLAMIVGTYLHEYLGKLILSFLQESFGEGFNQDFTNIALIDSAKVAQFVNVLNLLVKLLESLPANRN